jgi:hypothetical protein
MATYLFFDADKCFKKKFTRCRWYEKILENIAKKKEKK